MSLTKEQFIKALSADRVLTEKRENFLIALSSFSGQSATPDQVARKLGYSNKVVVNGLIGGLGKAIADFYEIEKENPDDEWWPVIASWYRESGDFHWQMHKDLFDAMIELNIISANTENSEDKDSADEGYEYFKDETYSEGHSKVVHINRYERNRKARNACIAHHGVTCHVCSFNFEEVYGREIGAGYIHVHHLIELSSVGEQYEVDPVADLRPVCPNCHSMLHRRRPAFSIEEVSNMINSNSKRAN